MGENQRDISELTALCNALADETITPDETNRLCRLLRDSEEARRFYVRFMAQGTSLHSYAGQMQTGTIGFPAAGFRTTAKARTRAWLAGRFAEKAASSDH